jgi:hypothetical protein
MPQTPKPTKAPKAATTARTARARKAATTARTPRNKKRASRADTEPGYGALDLLDWLLEQSSKAGWRRPVEHRTDDDRRIASLAQALGVALPDEVVRGGLGSFGPEGQCLRGWLELRRLALAFDQHGRNVLEGDAWGVYQLKGKPLRRVEASLSAFERTRPTVRALLPEIRLALCAVLGWDPDVRVMPVQLVDFPEFPPMLVGSMEPYEFHY